MNVKSIAGMGTRIFALAVIELIIMTVAGATFSIGLPTTGAPPAALFAGMALMASVDAIVVALMVLSSGWSSWGLAAAVAFSMIGVTGVMPISEAAWFGPALGITPGMIPALILPHIVGGIIFAPVAVWVLGRFKHMEPAAGDAPGVAKAMPLGRWAWHNWAWRLSVIAVVYFLVYYGFGLLIAWQNPALRSMYNAPAHPQLFDLSRLIPFQLFRALLWAAFALPVVRGSRGAPWQVAILTGLLLALPMNISLVMPNPFMPEASVRLSHFIETTSSNFLFGLFVTWLLYRGRTAARKEAPHQHAQA